MGGLEGLTFDDVLLRPQLGVLESRSEADISVPILHLKIPLIAAPMPSVASVKLLKEIQFLGGMGVTHRFQEPVKQARDFIESGTRTWAAIGIHDGLERTATLKRYRETTFVLDVAHAHSTPVLRFIEAWKSRFPYLTLVVGNVATYQGASDLCKAGADAIKVGIGPGSVCTTRKVTGFGVPQLEAIQECREGSWESDEGHIPVIADGGIRNSGDIVKALAAGADAVMIGSLFARSIEAGATSHYGCASEKINGHHAPEGIEITIETPPEPLEAIVKRLTWGIRSGLSYGGATNIQELQENAEWIRITDAGREESKL
jgi:IMP dehydrogenase/GMP reductase